MEKPSTTPPPAEWRRTQMVEKLLAGYREWQAKQTGGTDRQARR